MKLPTSPWLWRVAFVALQGLLIFSALAGFRAMAIALAFADAFICSGVAIYLSHRQQKSRLLQKMRSRRRG